MSARVMPPSCWAASSRPRGDFTFRIRPKISTDFDLNTVGVGGLSHASYLFVAELVEADDGFSQLQHKFAREVMAPMLWHAETSGSETKMVWFRFPSSSRGRTAQSPEA